MQTLIKSIIILCIIFYSNCTTYSGTFNGTVYNTNEIILGVFPGKAITSLSIKGNCQAPTGGTCEMTKMYIGIEIQPREELPIYTLSSNSQYPSVSTMLVSDCRYQKIYGNHIMSHLDLGSYENITIKLKIGSDFKNCPSYKYNASIILGYLGFF